MLDQLTAPQRAYLETGMKNEDGRLSLFGFVGEEFDPKMVRACIEKGLAERWFANPMEPSLPICKLTDKGRSAVEKTIT